MADSANSPILSRRNTLAIGVAGLAAGTLQSLTLAEAALSGPDADLVRLYRELQDQEQQCDAAQVAQSEREADAESKYPPMPHPFDRWDLSLDKYACISINSRIKLRANDPHYGRAYVEEMRQTYEAYLPKFEVVWHETGAAEAEKTYHALRDRAVDLQTRILETPAKGPQGVLVKLLVWHSMHNERDRTDWDAAFVMRSIVDLDRLTGGAIEMPSDVRPETIA